jgi:hypothetical protein
VNWKLSTGIRRRRCPKKSAVSEEIMATPTDADGMRSPRNSHVAGVSDLVRELKSGTVDTSDVMIEDDDQQAAPTIAADSAEEREALLAMEACLGDVSATAPEQAKLMCLRGRKYDPQRAAELLPKFLELCNELGLRQSGDHVISAEDAAQLRKDFATTKMLVPGGKDALGRAVLIMRLRYNEPKETNPEAMGRMIACAMLCVLQDVDVQRMGVVILNDAREIGFRNMDPRVPKFIFGKVLGRLPVRVGRIVVFHPPFIVGRILLPLMINFIIPKLKKRMSVINGGKIVAIHEFIHKEALFAEYDGTLEFTPGGEEAIEKVIATGKI